MKFILLFSLSLQPETFNLFLFRRIKFQIYLLANQYVILDAIVGFIFW